MPFPNGGPLHPKLSLWCTSR